MRRTFKIVAALVTALLLVLTVACAPAEAELVKGLLQNVDAVNGKVTIVTKDGRTVTVKIATETQVETEEATSSLAALEPGASVEVEVKDKERVARRIKARQSEVEGTIVGVESGNITIQTEKGRQVTIQVTNQTRIELEDDLAGTLADLQVGVKVEAKFDPSTRLAFKIEVEEEEEEEEEEMESVKVAPTPRVGWGIIEVRVTDPPPADVKSAVVYLTNIEVHKVSDNASDNASGWITVIGAPPSFDLMVVAEVAAVLGSANVTAGRFTQIRMDVDRVEVVTADGANFTATVPSEKLKIVRPFNVEPGGKTILTLDFDGEKSLIITGKGRALFKPVVKLEIEKKKLKD